MSVIQSALQLSQALTDRVEELEAQNRSLLDSEDRATAMLGEFADRIEDLEGALEEVYRRYEGAACALFGEDNAGVKKEAARTGHPCVVCGVRIIGASSIQREGERYCGECISISQGDGCGGI